ncbi:helix-turn-helix domain-containing protein [uncultured Bacteroides sp.]|uniref:helix-turn-helix domain-containing protein n=1 Tax=uncultured Bacteroides sp. TaxID=162156 RepID=UPI0026121B46|nr:helix-turn-helix domain-containing protein [uncultured Bacteroides sp.]
MRLHYIFIILLYISLSVNSKESTLPSLILREISVTPEELLEELDSMENTGRYKEYKINYLRSYAYYSLCKYNRASIYADSVLHSEEVRKDSFIMLRTVVIAAESYALSSRLLDAANMVTAALSYSRRTGDTSLEANMMYVQGIIWNRMGLYEKSYKIIEDAISIFNGKTDIGSKLRISAILDMLADFYIDSGLYEKAWQVCERSGDFLKSFENSDEINPILIDRMYGVYYSKMAYLSLKLNRHALANDYYLRYKATRMSGTLMGALEINPYLLLIGRYEDVISNNKAFFLTTDNADTVSVVYRRSLLQVAISLKRLGKYEYAYRCLEKYNNIIESYRRNIDANRLFELYKAADYIRYEAGIEAARNELKSRQNLIVALFVLIGFLILFLIFILMERMMLRKKNRDISRLIVELNKSMESSVNELEKSDDVRSAEVVESAGPKSPEEAFSKADLNKMSNEALFRRFDSIVMNERLYLDYNLQRDYYASVMGVDRNRFATVIKEATDGGNLSTYLNNMRLNYSVTLFREHPEMSISEVGDASAIPNISTFYRLFKEKYGLSPKMFIEQLNSER